MGKAAGRNGVLYLAVTSGGTASPFTYLKSFKFEAKTDRIDTTSFQDTSKTYVSGLPDSTASYEGFWDTSLGFSNHAAYQAAVDGSARKWYFYPVGGSTPYLAGTGYFDASFNYTVSGAIEMSGSMSAATPTFTSG